jgi:hypothetical protein
LDKFIDKDGNWREHIQRVEEDKLKLVLSYSARETRERRGKVRVEREQEWDEENVVLNGIIIIIIIIIMFLGSISKDQQTTWPCDSHRTIR